MRKFKETANIILTGMPGTGKSTVGEILAKSLMRPFIDTDLLIQSGEGKRLGEIISHSGMKHFLALEEKYVMAIGATSSVISTGGSVIYSLKAMNKLASSGLIVHLDLNLQKIKERFSCMNERGVARIPGQSMESLYEERLPLYKNHSDLSLDCNNLSPGEIMDKILPAIKNLS
ncbi:MAG: shikimate kinase [Deltaproteobacteria bacterium]|nr:shikimate kinase [Deltaproteobacteria bacterium]